MKKIIISMIMLVAVTLVYGQGFDFGDMGGFGNFPGGGIMGGGISTDSGKATAKSEDAVSKLDGNIALRFFSAIDRSPIPGASVQITNVGNFTTDHRGRIEFPSIQDGNYLMTVRKAGFIETPITLRVVLGFVDFNWFNISPVIPDKDYRIVLEWGERPQDLDLHFVKSGGYHISYYNMKRAEDGNAVLDRDDMTGYGPETITIGKIDRNAVYECYVHDYTNGNNTSSNQLSRSGATIRVYSQNALLKSFFIPSGGRGTRWNVFKIERGALVDVNNVAPR
ncbi:MAG: hypothetical protein LBH16_11740 [Treponema sp.]|jgi:hypothetical protein|nr:hypothetical protein [Treponema sp.]